MPPTVLHAHLPHVVLLLLPQVLNLIIQCTDRPGLLAEIAQIIADYGHNIKTYSGRGDTVPGSFTMKYQLEGDPERAAALCRAIGRVPSVTSWSLGCALHEKDAGSN